MCFRPVDKLCLALVLGAFAGTGEAGLSLRVRTELAAPAPEAISGRLTYERDAGGRLNLALQSQSGIPIATIGTRIVVADGDLRCTDGNAALLAHPPLPALDLSWRCTLDLGSRTGSLDIEGQSAAGGRLSGMWIADTSGWRAEAQLSAIAVDTLWPWLPESARQHWVGTPQGRIDSLSLNAGATAGGVLQASARAHLAGLSLDSVDGEQAAADAAATIDLDWQGGERERLALRLTLTGGQVYVAPWFRDNAQAGALTASATLARSTGGWVLTDMAAADPGVLSMTARGRIPLDPAWWPPSRLDAEAYIADAGLAFERFADPLLAPRGLAVSLEGQGATATARWRDRRLVSWALSWPELDVALNAPALEIDGSRVEIGWEADAQRSAFIAWRDGNVYRVPLGRLSASAQVAPNGLSLTAPLRVPVFGGALVLDRLSIQNWQSLPPEVLVSGRVDPIDLPALTSSLGWPSLNGEISGVIPGVRYDVDGLTLEGALLIRVFDGLATVTRLRLKNVFGQLPVMEADIGLRNLDLGILTGAFDIGRIEGRLEGAIDGLRLEDWEVAEFDGWVATPPEDDSRHRISQRAVETLSSLGGASPGAALSRGFIGLFDSFGYDRLGVSCRLHAGVCYMNGVAPAEQGYYLVRGAGLPRIDVIGYNRQVDWSVLIERLKAAARSDGPVVR